MRDLEDELYAEAVKVCRDAGKISVSLIQRRLRIGYIRASLIVEEMGKRGIAERVDPDGEWVFVNAPHAGGKGGAG